MNTTAKAFARAIKENTLHFHSQRNALTMLLAFLLIMAVPVLPILSASTQTAWLFAHEKIVISEDIMGAAQTRKPLKRLDLNF
ncbi:hypothetical protein [Ruminococcus sp.]|uniref:hypothetical protein n=1 Tax=Ruminococcus sp. TaxID=41978 RepID=UPI00307B646A